MRASTAAGSKVLSIMMAGRNRSAGEVSTARGKPLSPGRPLRKKNKQRFATCCAGSRIAFHSAALRCTLPGKGLLRGSRQSLHGFPGRMQRKRNATGDPAQEAAAKRRKRSVVFRRSLREERGAGDRSLHRERQWVRLRPQLCTPHPVAPSGATRPLPPGEVGAATARRGRRARSRRARGARRLSAGCRRASS